MFARSRSPYSLSYQGGAKLMFQVKGKSY